MARVENRNMAPIVLALSLVFGPGLLMFFLARLWYLILNISAFRSINIMSALAMGVRFDLAFLCLINIPILLLAIGFWWFRREGRMLPIFFLAVNLPFLWADLADALYFRFTGRRSTFAVVQFFSDAKDQATHLAAQYFYVVLGIVFFTYLFTKLSLEVKKRVSSYSHNWSGKWLVPASLLGFAFLARGGYQEKPLTPAHAYGNQGSNWAALALNSGFNALKSKNQKIESTTYMANAEVKAVLDSLRKPSGFSPRPGQNIVLILVESLGLETMRQAQDVTPFLNSLGEKSLFFDNAFANGRRSIDAVPSVLGSLPALMAEPFINTEYRANHVRGLPNILGEHGYTSYFFHGGRNGTMFFDVMSAMFGVQTYFGKSEYGSGDDDGAWGIYDGPFLQKAVSELSKASNPFFSTIFTLSSHNPYKVPDSFQASGVEFSSPYYRSIYYVDQALAHFFQSAEKEPWFSNTLFIITGDHTGESKDPRYQEDLGNYRVPMLFYTPSGSFASSLSHKIVQHADIPATVLDYLGLLEKEVPPTLIGGSMMSEGQMGYVVLKSGEEFLLGKGDRLYTLLPDGASSSKVLSQDFYTGLIPDSYDGDRFIRALKQYFEIGMNENKLSPLDWR
ncbi:MAG: LTA synthase family protein [Pseudomonadota bacterium]